MRKYKLIGLTGQTGAGKSAAAEIFHSMGARVINADSLVAKLYTQNSPCVKTLAAVFGADILTQDGAINRKALAERAFSSKENTELLGKLVHPFVTAELFEQLREAHGVVIYDAPQLFESGADVICDVLVCVTADKAIRLKRIMSRDGLDEAAALSRINAQYDEAFFRQRADIIIENNGGEAELTQTAREIFSRL